MANQKISQMPSLTASELAAGDLLAVVDVSDVTQASSGSNKKITVTELQSAAVSAGTANGVLYLNGSKVATSGSALTFDGSLLNIAGSVRAQTSLLVYGSGDRLNVFPQAAGSGVLLLATNNANSAYAPLTLEGSATIFNASSSEQMRLTSTGLGIGTSSPAAKLDVSGAADGDNVIRASANSSNGLIILRPDGANGNTLRWGGNGANANTLRFVSGGDVERARIDPAGNLGLGVTPSAWGGHNTIEVSADFALMSPYTTKLISNAYYDGAWKYKTGGGASYFTTSQGAHKWFTAPSGTAGNTISFTQAMALDASGNLLVGTTTTNYDQFGLKYRADLGTLLSTSNNNPGFLVNRQGTTGGLIDFFHANNGVGDIATNGTSVSYNTSSDYRLKNITGPLQNSGVYIDSLNPVEGTWKADGSTFVGLIAHEVQEVSRTQVATGEKDGAEMQAMDYSNSELIANLIAEVKSLRARVAALESN